MAEDIDEKVGGEEQDETTPLSVEPEAEDAVEAEPEATDEAVEEAETELVADEEIVAVEDESDDEDDDSDAEDDSDDDDSDDEDDSDDGEDDSEDEDDDEEEVEEKVSETPKKKSKAQRRREEKEAAKSAKAAYYAAPEKEKSTVSTGLAVAIGIIALVLGLLCGKFLLGNIGKGSGTALGQSVLAESELDTVVGSYTYAGTEHTITAREVIENDTGIELARKDDGTFSVPSVESVLAFARNEILSLEVKDRGITVTEEDVAAYAESILGSSDYASIAETYMLDEATVVRLMTQSAEFAKLREQIVTIEAPVMPEAPAEPSADAPDAATADYANYIITLAGDEWDATNNTWVSSDSMYAMSLEGMNFDGSTADYTAALTAYYAAYQQYAQVEADISAQWTNYVNGLLANSSFEAYTLAAS